MKSDEGKRKSNLKLKAHKVHEYKNKILYKNDNHDDI